MKSFSFIVIIMLDEPSDADLVAPPEEFLCVGCTTRITDRWFYKTQEGTWHSDCLRCAECQLPLEEKCFAKHGHLYCREDYFRWVILFLQRFNCCRIPTRLQTIC